MKRAVAASAASPQRTIGEILLEHGYVTEEDLAAAVQRQQETGFPLGQILVEAGAITRLELASALAVQWADVAPARGPLEEQTGRPRAARREEDTEEEADAPLFSYASPAADDAWREEIRTAARAFAQRLDAVEQALDELRGEAGGEPELDVEAKFGELLGPLARHVDETGHRVQALEAAVEEVGAQSRAVGEAAEAVREELARRATAATTAIEELAARLEERPHAAAEADEVASLRTEVAHLRAEVTAFAAMPTGDQTARDQLADLSARVDALADPTALEDLRRALDSLAERPASDPVLAGQLQELASRLDEVADRPTGDTELTGRVDELSAILGSLTAAVEELREQPAEEDDGLEARLDELARRVHVLADASEAAAATESKLDALGSQLNDVVDRVGRIQHGPEESGIAALAARIDELERSAGANGEAYAPIGDGLDAEAMAQLTTQIAEATSVWERDRATLEAKVAELAQRVARAPAAAEGSGGASPDATPPNEHDLNRLWFAVERLSLQLTEHHRTLGVLMGGAGGEGQLEALAARVEILERLGGAPRPADGSEPAAGDGAVYGDLAVLARRVEEVALAGETGREKLLTQIEQMMSSLDWRFQRLESGGQAA
jgi:hypothetical protein